MAPHPPILLRARALSRQIDGRPLFSGLDLDAGPGLLWIRGPSGTGKSELLRLVAGLVEGSGTLELTVDGEPITPASVGWPAWRTRVAYVPQAAPRFDRPGEAVLAEMDALSTRRGRAHDDPRALAARWGLDPRAWTTPMAELSGGEAQRLWLAIVLAGRPEVVLLDEPTSALDPSSAASVEADLAGRTGLLVTHDAALGARLAAATLDLVDGQPQGASCDRPGEPQR